MQQFYISKKIIGIGKQKMPDHYITSSNQLAKKEYFKDNRIIKECKYFRTEKAALSFIKKDLEKDPKSSYGKPWIDKMHRCWAVWKYRQY